MEKISALILIIKFTLTLAEILVTIPNGIIRGRIEYSNRGISFYSFQQIPFAKPPLGELRFKEPQPVENWNGTLDATHNDKACFQMNNTHHANISAMETEDCMYLNVYTPRYPSNKTHLPVLFFIHGGGFIKGSAAMDYSGPHYLMEHDIIVVTVNYRVGPFGFLSTGDTIIPGNYGLKDQHMGLKWVKKNIRYFGGDPEKVTIFGISAGSASVTYQLMNKRNEGLFRAAIAASGTLISPWAYQRDYKYYAYKLATRIDPNFNMNSSSQELLDFLRSIPAADIKTAASMSRKLKPFTEIRISVVEMIAFINPMPGSCFDFVENYSFFSFEEDSTDGVSAWKEDIRNYQIFQGFFFTPVIEPDHENAFISENMYTAIENGRLMRVPLMMGFCSEEFLLLPPGGDIFQQYLREIDEDITLLVNKNMHLTDENQLKRTGEAILNIYTTGRLQDDRGAGVRLFGDSTFTRGIIRHAQMQSNFSDVYLYQFSYHGELGMNKGPFYEGSEKVTHGEDANYLWTFYNQTTLNNYSRKDILTSDRYRTLVTDFVKYLNPTPFKSELLDNIIWPKVTPDNLWYLNINETLSLEKNPKKEVYSKWLEIYENMAVKPYDTF